METQTQARPLKKMLLTRKQEQELKIFFLIIKKPMPPEEKVVIILAYVLEDAFTKATIDNPGYNIFFTGQSMTVRELLEKIYTEGEDLANPKPKTEKPKFEKEPKKIGFDEFKNGLLLAADYYAGSEDKEALKKIINGLKRKEG